MAHKLIPSTMLAMALFLVVGCNRRSTGIEKIVVSGTVTLNGKPVENGEVRFYPTNGTKGPVSGGPIRDGKYEARGGGGVPVGEHIVDIRGFRPMKYAAASDPEGGPVEQYIPARYNSDSTLTVTIIPNTSEKDFELTSRSANE